MKSVQRTDHECNLFMNNLTFLRRKYGYTQKQMSQLLGIGIVSWRMIERGIMPKHLSTNVVFRAKDVFGIPAVKLFSENIRMENTQ